MLIILEGPDGGGKSTLAQKFKEGRNPKNFHDREYRSQLGGRTMTGEEMRINTYKLLNDLRNGKLQDVMCVCERLHTISDEVYRGVFGGAPFLSVHEAGQVYKELGSRTNVRIIYCRPPIQAVIDAGLQKAGDDTNEWLEEVGARLRQLYRAYDEHMARISWHWGLSVTKYDFTDPASVRMIEGFLCAG